MTAVRSIPTLVLLTPTAGLRSSAPATDPGTGVSTSTSYGRRRATCTITPLRVQVPSC